MALVPVKSGVVTTKPKKKTKPNSKVWFWASECRYDVILNNVKGLGWKLIEDERNETRCSVYWIDVAAIHERFRSIQPWQMINHFPGMPNIARKNRMGQNLNRMLKMFPREYSFYPRTWVLPGELSDFRSQFDEKGNSIGNKIYIIKPDTGCQGRGIFLTRTFDQVPQHENVVAQLYIKKPLLLDGYKFDLRIYVMVCSVKPLRMYLFHDGLVRMCTEVYVKPTKQNIQNVCMHLTNYAVNKHNSNFQQPTSKAPNDNENGSKRSVHWFMNWVRENKGEAKADWLWNRIGILCVRTVLSIMPTLSREYDQHFRSFNNIPWVCPQSSERGAYGAGASGTTPSSSSSSDSRRDSNRGTNGGGHGARSASNGGNGRGRGNSSSTRNASDHPNNNNNEEDDEDNDDNNDAEEEEDEDEEGTATVQEYPRGRSSSNNNNNSSSSSSKPSLAPTATSSGSDNNNETSSSSSSGGNGNSHGSTTKMPSTRGSRCFEILGFDIMIDSKLRPWLIEVNHLPSFGTDSPLDLDIKARLMKQCLRALSVQPDDEQAYAQSHKLEAEKRLMTRREKDREELEHFKNGGGSSGGYFNNSYKANPNPPGSTIPRPPVKKTLPNKVPPLSDSSSSGPGLGPGSGPGDSEGAGSVSTTLPTYRGAAGGQGLGSALSQATEPLSAMHPVDNHSNNNSSLSGAVVEVASGPGLAPEEGEGGEVVVAPVTPERLEEIKSILLTIYLEFSPEKVSKIDRLLNKYHSREEEFLRFVRHKYGIPPPAPLPLPLPSGPLGEAIGVVVPPPPVILPPTGMVLAGMGANGSSKSSTNGSISSHGDASGHGHNSGIVTPSTLSYSGVPSTGPSSAHTTARRDSNNNNYGSDDGNGAGGIAGGEGGSGSALQQVPQPRPPAHQRDREMPDRPGPSRFARSLSPPPVQHRWGSNNGNNNSNNNHSGGHGYANSSSSHNMRAPTSNWKSTQEEDQAYRCEILANHMPSETDEWMAFEMGVLKEFTRIFPMLPDKKNDKLFPEEFDGGAGGDDEENEGDDDDGLPLPLAGGSSSSSSGGVKETGSGLKSKATAVSATITTGGTSSGATKPAASYEEILYQVFVHDKRQFQRMHNPLPRTMDNGSLPPLESNTARSSSSGASSQGGSGQSLRQQGLGWRAPPKPQEKKDQKQPTQTQLDAAKRLSQGMSVKETSYTAGLAAGVGIAGMGGPGAPGTGLGYGGFGYAGVNGTPQQGPGLAPGLAPGQGLGPGGPSGTTPGMGMVGGLSGRMRYQGQGLIPPGCVLDQDVVNPNNMTTPNDPYAYAQMQAQSQLAQAQAYAQHLHTQATLTGQVMNQQQQQQILMYTDAAAVANGWPRRAVRMIEESRVARMRIEAAKAMAYAKEQAQGPAAILRQQVFAFDNPTVPVPTSAVLGSNNNNGNGSGVSSGNGSYVLSEGPSAGQGLGPGQGGVSGKGVAQGGAVSGKVVGPQTFGLNSGSISSTYQQQQLSRMAAAARF